MLKFQKIITSFFLGLVLAITFAACGGEAEPMEVSVSGSALNPEAKDWNVVVIVLDTLRADGLGCYGNPLPVSPNIDSFAAEGIQFDHAWAVSPGTASSHASLFSSTYPETHGVWNREMGAGGKPGETYALAPEAVTLAEAFQGAGFFTSAIADGGFVSEARGLDQGFSYFESFTRGGPAVFSHANKWLTNHSELDEPFFLFVHTYETHVPFVPMPSDVAQIAGAYQGPMRKAYEAAFAESNGNERLRKKQTTQAKHFRKLLHGELLEEDKAFYRTLYDAEIMLTDRLVGGFLEQLKVLGLSENTLVLITSDHGEEFWEHGKHGHTQIYEEQLHIPLLLKIPGGPKGLHRTDLLDQVDFLPSLLAAVGIPVPATAMGRDVDFSRHEDDSVAAPRWVVGQNNYPLSQTALRLGQKKWIEYADEMREPEFFLLDDDPSELDNHAGKEDSGEFASAVTAFAEDWSRKCQDWISRHRLESVKLGATQRLPAQSQNELEQLGYVDGDEEE